MKFLYKKNRNNKIEKWKLEVKNCSHRSIKITSGDKQVVGSWTTLVDKASNIKMVKSKYKSKLDKGYCMSVKDAKIFNRFEVQLAEKFEKHSKNIQYPCAVQTKLDGIRCYITKDGAYSRFHKEFVSIPHILNDLKDFFLKNPTVILDGELYNHEFKHDFNQIVSIVKTKNLSVKDLQNSEKYMQYHIYDIYEGTNLEFFKRSSLIHSIFQKYNFKYCKRVVSYMCSNEKAIKEYHTSFIKDGYEGSIIRQNKEYDQFRTPSLLKLKDWQDEEFEIVAVIEGKGKRTSTCGKMTLKMSDGTQFDSNIKGTMEYYKQLLQDKDKLIGKFATVCFKGYTPKGIPRHGIIKTIRDYEN